MDIQKLKNNKKYSTWDADLDVTLSLKENPEFNLRIWVGYFEEIFKDPILIGRQLVGFTRDSQEDVGGWKEPTEIENIDEYIWDMLRYKDKEYTDPWEDTPEVFNLVVDFLTYAKQTNQTVIVEVDY